MFKLPASQYGGACTFLQAASVFWCAVEMDARTIASYDDGAAQYCDEWLSQPPADDLQRLWREFFAPGRPTADIGSGSGRDVDWLNRHGYPCVGWDASLGLIDEARQRFPRRRFEASSLPQLVEVLSGAYANVVCETVIMHLDPSGVTSAVGALRRILAPHGTLYLSWRVSGDGDSRDSAGRLYSSFDTDSVRAALAGMTMLYDSEETSASSRKRVHRLVARADAGLAARKGDSMHAVPVQSAG